MLAKLEKKQIFTHIDAKQFCKNYMYNYVVLGDL